MTEIWNLFKHKWKNLWKNFFFSCFLPSLGCYLFVELCSRRSVLNLGLFFLRNPFVFFYNVLIVATTASVSLLFKRRIFALTVILSMWGVIGVADLILLSFRTTPFTAVDLLLIENALSIMDRYLSGFEFVLIVCAIIGVVVLCVYLFVKAKKEEERINHVIGVSFCGLLVLLCLFLTNAGMAIGLLDRNFGNLAEAFHENGLPYCFMNSILNTGVEKPDNYSSEAVDNLVEEIEEGIGKEIFVSENEEEAIPDSVPDEVSGEVRETMGDGDDAAEPTEEPVDTDNGNDAEQPDEGDEVKGEKKSYPNVIFLQLESFFDVKYIENSSYTEDPVAFFTHLKETYPSGFLSVPSVGAGTANTEFECITGMNLDFFGPGEYPYKTILMDRTCESLAYILKKEGFSTSALHNNEGTFYSRNQVFSNLGFDRFVSVEYMEEVEVNELNWAKDEVLTEEIMKILQHTEEPDYVYAISVQGHGAYPKEPLLENPAIDVQLPEELSEYYYQYLYYVNEIHEMDAFLKNLVLSLDAWPEDVVLVMYGDHLPNLGLDESLLENRDLFQTEYIIWSNFEMETEDKDLQSYQLGARVCELLGIEEGILMQYHRYFYEEEDYFSNMQLLMYDMLYGDMEVYDGVNPYEPTELQMGMEDITIQDAYMKTAQLTEEEPILYVTGTNFTEWSKIAVNGKEIETIYLNRGLLAAMEFPLEDDASVYSITVRQQGNDEFVLSETREYEFEVSSLDKSVTTE